MESKILEIIIAHKLICAGDTVLLGVSGGADSVTMLRVLHDLMRENKFKIAVAHLNHGIRGNKASEDAEFVKILCDKLQIPFYTESVDVPARAKRESLSIEMAARKERYEFFKRAAGYFNTELIATAHTADDQAETVLLKLVRGAGIDGLSGIALCSERNGLKLIRPLLNISRLEIENYLKSIGQNWHEDLSNKDVKYLRNKVRHQLLPWLEDNLNPAIRETLCRTADILSKENIWLNSLTAEKALDVIDNENRLAVKLLATFPLAIRRRIIRLWLNHVGIDINFIDYNMIEQIDELLCRDNSGTKYLPLPGDYQVVRRYNIMELEKKKHEMRSVFFQKILKVPSELAISELAVEISAEIKPGIIKNCNGRVGEAPAEVSISFHAVGDSPIIIRAWKKGDKIKPLGINGTQKLQDIFVNERVPVDMRGRVLVFECRGEIIWIPNYRVARGWEVFDNDKKSIIIKIKQLDC